MEPLCSCIRSERTATPAGAATRFWYRSPFPCGGGSSWSTRGCKTWEYVGAEDYSRAEYAVLATLAFSTVVPALHSAWGITLGWLDPRPMHVAAGRRAWYAAESLAGVAMVAMVFAVPDLFFPLVWVGPFLLLDGLVGMEGGRSLAADVCWGDWRLATAIGLAGLMCGFLWEFWNYWSTPKWIYHIPYLNYLRAFEMPVLGYAGYIPFAWSVYQLLQVRPIRRYIGGPFSRTVAFEKGCHGRTLPSVYALMPTVGISG